MNRQEYINDQYVISFSNWIEDKLNDNFMHHYDNQQRHEKWSCNSIFNAFEKYKWGGLTFDEVQVFFDRVTDSIEVAINNQDEKLLKKQLIDIIEWGGIKKVSKSIQNRSNIIDFVMEKKEQLNLDTYDTNTKSRFIEMGSGYSKIYSFLIQNFIIYDSRVGAALCYLVRLFCEHCDINKIPEVLAFRWQVAENKYINRDPSNDKLIFQKYYNSSPNQYLITNIKASWLLANIISSTTTNFNNLENPVRALEAALFMIGYELPTD